jgi:hypothetical protein
MYLRTPTQGRDRSNKQNRWAKREEAQADNYITGSLGFQKLPEWVIFLRHSKSDVIKRRNR